MERFLFTIIGEPDHYDRWDRVADQERDDVFAQFAAFSAAVEQRGRVVAGEALGRPSSGFHVPRADAVVGAARAGTDGPYAEAVDQLCGFYLADLPDEAAAREVARLLPRQYSVEVRACPDVGVTPR